MAYAAVHDRVPPLAWWLLGINLFWVIAYDTEYAMVDRDDDCEARHPHVGDDVRPLRRPRRRLCYAVYLAGMAWLGRLQALGPIYYGGLAVALLIALRHLWIIRHRDRGRCFRAFLGNHWLGMAVFAGVALDYAVRLARWPRAW